MATKKKVEIVDPAPSGAVIQSEPMGRFPELTMRLRHVVEREAEAQEALIEEIAEIQARRTATLRLARNLLQSSTTDMEEELRDAGIIT